MGRPNQPLLSREIIARAALELLDEEGPQALKMRALADRLGVRGASLYHHVASKDDVLDAVSELINDEIDLSPLDEPDWRAGIAAYARGYRRVYLRHPNAIAPAARRRVEADRALRGYDALLGALIRAGCTLRAPPRPPPPSTTWSSAPRSRPSPPGSPAPRPTTAPPTRPSPTPSPARRPPARAWPSSTTAGSNSVSGWSWTASPRSRPPGG